MISLSVQPLLWFLAVGLPLVLAAGTLLRRYGPVALAWAPWTPLLALAVGVVAPSDSVVSLPWLLLGAQLGMDATTRVFLCFTALLWTCAGFYARAYLVEDPARQRFFAFFLAALSGNVGLVLAHDAVTFYLFFALMSFASYGLVIHDGTREAYRAGRVYIILVVVGEVLLVSALFLMVPGADTVAFSAVSSAVAAAPRRDLIVALTLAGFGIKAGMLPLHVWLPLAHPVAPTPASAVLSGAMIKAGLLGWIRFLPVGEGTFPGWSGFCIGAGLLAAFYGVLIGLTQTNAKTALAYSSISQMGFMTIAVGIGFASPVAWPAAVSAALLYALHHALAKGALFLGVGVVQQVQNGWQLWVVLAGLLCPALALAGAPLTSGALAKLALKDALAFFPLFRPGWLEHLLSLAAVGTTVLMARFLYLLQPGGHSHAPRLAFGLWVPWMVLLLSVLGVPWLFVSQPHGAVVSKTLSFSAFWPVGVGVVLAGAAWRFGRRWALLGTLRVPSGDVLITVTWLMSWWQRQWRSLLAPLMAGKQEVWLARYRITGIERAVLRMEGQLGRWANAGLLFLLLAGVLFATFVFG
ncbi:MAG: complex I subunit 5 family protein [Candidatus Binatia bacterium]|nr:complex I subunit 5 family protein [Candidatus Binatia bacterium]